MYELAIKLAIDKLEPVVGYTINLALILHAVMMTCEAVTVGRRMKIDVTGNPAVLQTGRKNVSAMCRLYLVHTVCST